MNYLGFRVKNRFMRLVLNGQSFLEFDPEADDIPFWWIPASVFCKIGVIFGLVLLGHWIWGWGGFDE